MPFRCIGRSFYFFLQHLRHACALAAARKNESSKTKSKVGSIQSPLLSTCIAGGSSLVCSSTIAPPSNYLRLGNRGPAHCSDPLFLSVKQSHSTIPHALPKEFESLVATVPLASHIVCKEIAGSLLGRNESSAVAEQPNCSSTQKNL